MLLDHEPPLLGRRHLGVAGGLVGLVEIALFPVGGQVSQRHGQASRCGDVRTNPTVSVRVPNANRFAMCCYADFRFFDAFFGTFLPLARASDSPIAIACLRLVTLRPERPLFKVPALRFFIARSTSAGGFFEYPRAMVFLPVAGE